MYKLLAIQDPRPIIPELLGGLLLDGIEAAERASERICEGIVEAAISCKDREGCARLVRLIRTWRGKESFDEVTLQKSLRKVAASRPAATLGIVALAPAIGLPQKSIFEWLASANDGESLQHDIGALFGYTSNGPVRPDPAKLEALLKVAQRGAFESPAGNLVASLLQLVFCNVSPELGSEYLFRLQLSTLRAGIGYGPFEHLCRHTVELAKSKAPSEFSLRDHLRVRPADNAMELLFAGLRKKSLEIKAKAARRRTRRQSPQSAAVHSMMKKIPNLRGAVPTVDLTASAPPPTLVDFATDVICCAFDLQPAMQWKVSLENIFPSAITNRFWPLEPAAKEQLESQLRSGALTEGDSFLAAWMLIFDAWCSLSGCSMLSLDRSFSTIIDGTRDMSYPPLRIAHAFRDTVLEGKRRADSLIRLAEDDLCASILIREGWTRRGFGQAERHGRGKARSGAPSLDMPN